MASKVKTVPFPHFLAKTPCIVNLESEGVTPDGEQITVRTQNLMCIYDEKSHRITDKDGKEIRAAARVIICGDIAPDFSSVSSGTVEINGCKMTIAASSRPRNPNGTIHHTELELI